MILWITSGDVNELFFIITSENEENAEKKIISSFENVSLNFD